MNERTEFLIKMTVIISITIAALIYSFDSHAGAEPSGKLYTQAERAHAEKMIKQGQRRAFELYQTRKQACEDFGGRLITPDSCHVDQAQLYYCNTIKSPIQHMCVTTKGNVTVVNINGSTAPGSPINQSGQYINQPYRTRNGHPLPAPNSLLLMVTALISIGLAKIRRKK